MARVVIGTQKPDDALLEKVKAPWWARLLGLVPEWKSDSDGLGVPFWRVAWRRPPVQPYCTCDPLGPGPYDDCAIHGRGGPEDSFT